MVGVEADRIGLGGWCCTHRERAWYSDEQDLFALPLVRAQLNRYIRSTGQSHCNRNSAGQMSVETRENGGDATRCQIGKIEAMRRDSVRTNATCAVVLQLRAPWDVREGPLRDRVANLDLDIGHVCVVCCVRSERAQASEGRQSSSGVSGKGSFMPG